MTDNDLNKAIFEWMGGKGHRCFFVDGKVHCEECGTYFANAKHYPQYTSDHKKVRKFLEAVDAKNEDWPALFWDEFCFTDSEGSHRRTIRLAVFATPRQLAEAGAKAVGIWREIK